MFCKEVDVSFVAHHFASFRLSKLIQELPKRGKKLYNLITFYAIDGERCRRELLGGFG